MVCGAEAVPPSLDQQDDEDVKVGETNVEGARVPSNSLTPKAYVYIQPLQRQLSARED